MFIQVVKSKIHRVKVTQADLNYIGSDGEKHRPVMVHRVILGAIERFIGVLIEHYAGNFPLWIAPVQVKVLNVTDNQAAYVEQVCDELRSQGVRVQSDLRNEKLGFKIREAQMEKVPYMLVVGEKEMNERKVSLRRQGKGDLGSVGLEAIIQTITDEIHERRDV